MVLGDSLALALPGEAAVCSGRAMTKYVRFTVVHPEPRTVKNNLYLPPSFAKHCAKSYLKTISFNLYKTPWTGTMITSFYKGGKLSHREVKYFTCAHAAVKWEKLGLDSGQPGFWSLFSYLVLEDICFIN